LALSSHADPCPTQKELTSHGATPWNKSNKTGSIPFMHLLTLTVVALPVPEEQLKVSYSQDIPMDFIYDIYEVMSDDKVPQGMYVRVLELLLLELQYY
ncbi:unnamed protein product, partial [Allacma fusca]